MSLFGYLHKRAFAAILADDERASITRSLLALQTRLNLFFGPPALRQIVFGSYRRGTILPRAMDPLSDVDFMVVFPDTGFKPQTYLDRLRRFVEARYRSSEVAQSNPTIVLELNHIRFELVPALAITKHDFYIPKGPDEWQVTCPMDAQAELERRNREERMMLKPALRLLKYWNAANDYPFASYPLEVWALRQHFNLSRPAEVFCEMISRLPLHGTQWGNARVERARRIVDKALQYRTFNYDVDAAQEIRKLIPER